MLRIAALRPAAHRLSIMRVTTYALVGYGLFSGYFAATGFAASRPDQIRIEYVAPADPQHRRLYELLQQRRVLERFQQFLAFIRLPQPLLLTTAGCDGQSSAWYDPSTHAVTMCYEFLADLDRNAPRETTPAGVTPQDAITGRVVEVFLHEIAHGLFDLLKIPVLGREEDAADQVAAYVLVSLGEQHARSTVVGAAYMYHYDAQRLELKPEHFADVHSFEAQRFYNVLCIAYGSNPKLFADVIDKDYLPQDRAEGCEEEFKQVRYAIRTLFRPYIDLKLARKAGAFDWIAQPTHSR